MILTWPPPTFMSDVTLFTVFGHWRLPLSKYISTGIKLEYISILPKLISNTTLEIILIDKVYKNVYDFYFYIFYLKVILTKRNLITSRREQIPNIMTIDGPKYELVYSIEIGYVFIKDFEVLEYPLSNNKQKSYYY